MSEHAAILSANDAFYEAVNRRDMAAMSVLWAQRVPVACLHPGWHPLIGRGAVLDAWQVIFRKDEMPEVTYGDAQVHLWSGGFAAVICYESVGRGRIIATNLFMREDGAWRLVHHQAGPAPALPSGDETPPPAGR